MLGKGASEPDNQYILLFKSGLSVRLLTLEPYLRNCRRSQQTLTQFTALTVLTTLTILTD